MSFFNTIKNTLNDKINEERLSQSLLDTFDYQVVFDGLNDLEGKLKEVFDQINNLTILAREIELFKQDTIRLKEEFESQNNEDLINIFWSIHSEKSPIHKMLPTQEAKSQYLRLNMKLKDKEYKMIIDKFDVEIKSIENHLWNLKQYQQTLLKKYGYYESLDILSKKQTEIFRK